MDQTTLLESLLNDLKDIPDHKITDTVSGSHLVAVESRKDAPASWVVHDHSRPPEDSLPQRPLKSAKEIAQLLLSGNSFEASVGLASSNSLLPTSPIESLQEIKDQELIPGSGRGKNVAVIGHFPFVERMRNQFKEFRVLERGIQDAKT